MADELPPTGVTRKSPPPTHIHCISSEPPFSCAARVLVSMSCNSSSSGGGSGSSSDNASGNTSGSSSVIQHFRENFELSGFGSPAEALVVR